MLFKDIKTYFPKKRCFNKSNSKQLGRIIKSLTTSLMKFSHCDNLVRKLKSFNPTKSLLLVTANVQYK